MISAWDAYENQIQSAQENTFGEYFTYEPRISRANKPTVAHPSQTVVNCLPAVFTMPSDSDRLRHAYTEHSTRNPSIEIRACNLPFDVQQGDVLVQQRSGRRFEVTGIRPSGYGLLKLDLIKLGLSPQRP